MALRAIESWEPIKVEAVVVHVFGDPGIGKGTLANTGADVLKLVLDEGEYRALGRQRSLAPESWGDLAGVVEHPWFHECKTLAIDTYGRLVEMAIAQVTKDPKCGSPGSPNQNGWPKVKQLVVGFFGTVRRERKDIIVVSHAKIDRDDTNRKTATPDIPGGSAGELYKTCDAMAYYSMNGGKRVLDFSVTDTHLGKNPPGWAPFVVPDHAQAPRFLAERIMAPLKAHLNSLSEEQTAVLKGVSEWGAAVEALAPQPEVFTSAIAKVQAELNPAVKAQAKTLLWRRAKALGLDFDQDAKAFKPAAKPAQEAPPAGAPAPVEGTKAACSMDHDKLAAKAKGGKTVVCGECGEELRKTA